MENRAVLYGMEARGREPCRGAETARPRTPGPHSDVRRPFPQLTEAGRGRNPAGELSGAWKTAVRGGGGELSRGGPLFAGDPAWCLPQRRAGAGVVATRPAALPSGA